MECRKFTVALVCAGIFTGLASSVAGEKIQFSTPSQDTKVPSGERELPRSSPNLFDKFRNGGADALLMPMPVPQNRAPQRNTDDRDWRLTDPEEGELSAEDLFRKKKNDSKAPGLADYVRAVEKQEAESQPLNLRERDWQQETFDSSANGRDQLQSVFRSPNLNFDPEKFNDASYTLNDYWRETTGLDMERFTQQATVNRGEFQQILQPRNLLEEVGVQKQAAEAGQANALMRAPTDFNTRTSQSSISDAYQDGYAPLTGSRTTVFDDVNARSLGRDSSSPLNTKIEPPRVEAQPAILPFPSRPGELFKRPGSF